MSNPTPSGGLTRFAAAGKPLDLDDPDQATRYVTDNATTLTSAVRALRELRPGVAIEVLHTLWSTTPELIRSIATRRPSPDIADILGVAMGQNRHPGLPVTLAELVAGSTDEELDWVIAHEWALHRELTDLILARLRRHPPGRPDMRGTDESMWSHAASTVAASGDPRLLGVLVDQGTVRPRYALRAAREAGLPLAPLAGIAGGKRPVRWLLKVMLYWPGPLPIHGDDIQYLVDQAHWIDDRYQPDPDRISFTSGECLLTADQRLALLQTGHPGLASVVGAVLCSGPRGVAGAEEVELLRTLVASPATVHVGQILGGRAADIFGAPWLLDQVDTTISAEEMAGWLDGRQEALDRRLYVAIGRGLRGRCLTEWLAARHDDPALEQIIQGVDPRSLLEHLPGLGDMPRLCMVLPGLPVAIAAADRPPSWAALLVTSAIGAGEVELAAAQAVIDDGFDGSFVDLRARVINDEAASSFEISTWFRDLVKMLR